MTTSARGHLAMLAFSALVAGAFALGRMAAPFIAAEVLTVIRFALAAILVGALAHFGPGIPRSALAAPWRWALLGGLMGIYFVLMFIGLRTSSAVSMSTVFTLTPLLSAGFGWILMRQATTGRMGLALAMGALGALWVIFDGSLASLLALQVGRGEVLFFFGCAAHALYTPLVRRLNRGESALVSATFTMAGGFVVVALFAGAKPFQTDYAALPAVVWICLAWLVIGATAASFVLIQYATMRLPSAKVMAYTYLVPAWVVVWEVVVGQGFAPMAILPGVGLVLLALVLLLRD